MNAQFQTQSRSQAQPGPSFARSSLKRRCACGGTPGPTGECEECRKKRTAGASKARAPDSPVHLTQQFRRTSVPTRPSLVHDFRHVRVHPDTPDRAIGQGIAPHGPVPADVNTPPIDVITGSGGTPSVKLTYSTVSRTQGGCGDFDWIIKWNLLNATASTNGFIVQKVKTDMFSQDCQDETNFDDQFDFWWEAWPVRNGQIMGSGGDEFRTSNTFGEKGSTLMSGEAKYMDAYTEPQKWGHHKPAGSMPAKGRSLRLRRCCGGYIASRRLALDDWPRCAVVTGDR